MAAQRTEPKLTNLDTDYYFVRFLRHIHPVNVWFEVRRTLETNVKIKYVVVSSC